MAEEKTVEKPVTNIDKGDYIIAFNLIGLDIWTKAPDYKRVDGAKFHISDKLTAKDAAHLHACGIAGITKKEKS